MLYSSTRSSSFFLEAIGVLAPHADGSGNDLLVGRYLQIGIVFGILFQIPGFILWSVYMYDTIIWFGFDEQTAIIAQNYAYSILLYLMAETINECILAFFDVIDHEKYVTIFSMIRACVSSGVLVAMASFGVSNMVAIGLARTLVEITLLFANIIFVVNQGWFDDFSVGLVKTFGLKVSESVGVCNINLYDLVSDSLLFSQYATKGSTCNADDFCYCHPSCHSLDSFHWRGKKVQ